MGALDKFNTTKKTTGGALSKFTPKSVPQTNEQLIRGVAQQAGLQSQAETILSPKPKLSFLGRISAGLGAFETGNAFNTGIETKSFTSGLKQYGKDVVGGIKSAFTGKDQNQTDKKHYSDVLKKVNPTGNTLADKVIQKGGGLFADIFLDPSTYLGGRVASTITSGIGAVAKKVIPQGLKQGAGKAFVFGYGTSKGLPQKALEITGQISKAKGGIVASNIERLGTGTLSKSQSEELVSKLLAGKRAEFGARSLSKDIAQSADWFQPFKAKATRMVETRAKSLRILEREINTLEKKGLRISLKAKSSVTPDVVSKLKIKTTPTQVIFDEADNVIGGKVGSTQLATEYAIPNTKDVKIFVESLIHLPKAELVKVTKLIGTREGWKKGLLDEITKLNNEYRTMSELQQDTYKLADVTRVGGKTAALETAASTDPLVQKTITEQSARSQKFAKAANIDDPFTVYFPGIAKDKIQRVVDNPAFLKVSKEGYAKEFKDLLKDDELIRNPAEAFSRVEFQIAKDNIVKTQLHSMIDEFGKPLNAFKSTDDALKAGFLEVKEKGMFGKAIGYLAKEDKQFLDNLISPEFTTIDRIAKATGFDAVTALFKRSVTGLFPSFHVRNYVSGLIQNYEVLGPKALSPKNIAVGQRIALKIAQGKKFGADTIDISGKAYKLDKVTEPFAKRFETSSQYITDIADATAEKNLIPKLSQKLNPLSSENPIFKTARAIGNYIETQQKATAYITALRSGRTVKQALEYATRAGFDYRALTPFESKIMRRIIPFYSFTRKNIELQLRTLGENPQRINNVLKLARSLQGGFTSEEKAQLPDYAQEQFSAKVGTSASGLPEIAVGFGTPIEQITTLFSKNPIRKIAATLNPIFKLPLERAFGKDFFRDRPLSEVVEAGEYARAPQIIKDFLQVTPVEKTNKDGTTRTVYNANPYRLQLLRNLPTTRGASYVSAIFDEAATTKARILNSLTGIKPRPIDLETVQYFKERDKQKELEDLLIRAGVLKKFEKVYEPK